MKWFKHDADMHQNRKIRKLIRTHGATGYAFWCVLLEKIYFAEGDFQISADELWFEDIAEDLKLGDYRTPIRILDTLSELGLISSQLWQDHVIAIPAVTERGDQYLIKRASEAEKKREQRAKKTQLSPRDKTGTKRQKVKMSPSDTDLDLDLDPDPEKSIKDLVLDSHTLSASAEIKSEEGECDKKNAVDPWQDPEPPKTRPTPINQTTVNQVPTTSSAALDQGSAPRERESFSSIPERPAFGVTRRVSNLEKEPSQWVPRWRKGMGPNEWHEGFVDWMTVNMFSGAKRSRGDVVAYLRKREADPTGAARQDIEAKFDDYELSWAAKTGNPADDEWIELGKLVSHVMEKKNVA
jgi:Domain of unknown function (DUF4373)